MSSGEKKPMKIEIKKSTRDPAEDRQGKQSDRDLVWEHVKGGFRRRKQEKDGR